MCVCLDSNTDIFRQADTDRLSEREVKKKEREKQRGKKKETKYRHILYKKKKLKDEIEQRPFFTYSRARKSMQRVDKSNRRRGSAEEIFMKEEKSISYPDRQGYMMGMYFGR